MNSSRAKNLAIIFLILLNIFLGVLVDAMSEKKSLTGAEEQAVYKYLSQNKVNLYSIMLKEYSPMRQIRLTASDFDKNKLKDFIFLHSNDVKISFEQDTTIYQLDNKKLSIAGNHMIYEDLSEVAQVDLKKHQAVQICNELIKKSGRLFYGYALDRIYYKGVDSEEGQYLLEYRLLYDKDMVYDSILQFTLKGETVIGLECTNYQVRSWEGNEKEILSPDEAVYAFVQNINYIYGEQETLVDSMDIVYVILEPNEGHAWQIAVPHYRFYIFGNEYPILINAYTGESLSYSML